VTGNAHNPRLEGGGGSRLSELLECERELAELMAAAKEDARRRVAEAQSEAGLAEAEGEASLEEASERVRREVREAGQARVDDILTRAREQAAMFEALSDRDVERLAEHAYRRLLRVEDPA